jgi:hypothetical protein
MRTRSTGTAHSEGSADKADDVMRGTCHEWTEECRKRGIHRGSSIIKSYLEA